MSVICAGETFLKKSFPRAPFKKLTYKKFIIFPQNDACFLHLIYMLPYLLRRYCRTKG